MLFSSSSVKFLDCFLRLHSPPTARQNHQQRSFVVCKFLDLTACSVHESMESLHEISQSEETTNKNPKLPRPRCKRVSRKRSAIWDHFTSIENGVACKYCGKKYFQDLTLGTSTFWAHLTNRCAEYPYRIEKKQKVVASKEQMSDLEVTESSLEEMRLKLATMIRHLVEEENADKKSELVKYLSEKNEATVDHFDILGWWKNNAINFPSLAQLAKDVLAIPVSTVSSESAFSTSGRILDPFWSSLSPTMVEALVCGQNWLRSKSVPIDLRHGMDEVEKYEELEIEFEKAQSPIIVEPDSPIID